MNVVEIENLSFSYNGMSLLDGTDLVIKKGEFLRLTGPNGSGKSTLIRLLTGELQPQSGLIRLFGKDITKFKDWRRIGYLPQNKAGQANFPATAFEVVMTGLYGEKGNIKQMALEALRLVNMKEYKDTLIGKLSGGQLQRVMAARVLAGGHDLLLLDEPMTGLDAAASQEMYKILCSLVRENGTTCLMISHDMSKLPEMPDSRILCLEYGNIIELDYEQFVRERASRHTHPKREKL